jgi:hypothetical protein
MRKALVIGLLSSVAPALVGCAQMSERDARATFASVESALHGGSHDRGQALSVDVDFDLDCRYGGELQFRGALDTDDKQEGAFDATFEYDVTFDECENDENTVDGNVQYASMFGADWGDGRADVEYVYVYRGSVVVTGDTEGVCDFDVTGSVTHSAELGDGFFGADTQVEYDGIICGRDAHDVLDERYDSKLDGDSSIRIEWDS